MSLASLLLGKGTSAADADLDAVFTRTKVEKPVDVAQASTSRSKIIPPQEIIRQAKIAKAKAGNSTSARSSSKAIPAAPTGPVGSRDSVTGRRIKSVGGKKGRSSQAALAPTTSKRKQIEGASATASTATPETSKKRRRESKAGDDDTQESISADILEASEDEDELENEQDSEDEDEDEDEDNDQPLIHETLLLQNGIASTSSASLQPRAKKAAKHAGESQADRDARTTFVGNVPVVCATNKSFKKALVRHLISTLPEEQQSIAKLDTIRFRSIQLAAPAFKSDGRDGDDSIPQGVGSHNNNAQEEEEEDDEGEESEAEKDKPINHSRKRSRRWKTGEVEAPGKKPLKFLTAAQKKKIGFIKGQVHEKASTCIAYIVWDIITFPSSSSASSSSKTKTSTTTATTTPQEIASLIVKHGDNTIFEKFTLRVDHVKGSSTSLKRLDNNNNDAAEETSKRELAIEQKNKLEEEKKTLYIGALDFEEKEQSIRELCENLMIEERGKPIQDDNDDGTTASWVERVRLVRDPETGLGKGFAYVMFKDRECVDEMLALDSVRVKLSKRKLRLERCKTSAAKAAAVYKAAKEAAQTARKDKMIAERKALNRGIFDSKKLPNIPFVKLQQPRPDIGDQLKELSKDERKNLKAADDERLARRLNKKNSKRQEIKIEKQKEVLDRKIKSAGGSSYKSRIDPAKEGMKRSKRMRSDNAVFAKNKKKTS